MRNQTQTERVLGVMESLRVYVEQKYEGINEASMDGDDRDMMRKFEDVRAEVDRAAARVRAILGG